MKAYRLVILCFAFFIALVLLFNLKIGERERAFSLIKSENGELLSSKVLLQNIVDSLRKLECNCVRTVTLPPITRTVVINNGSNELLIDSLKKRLIDSGAELEKWRFRFNERDLAATTFAKDFFKCSKTLDEVNSYRIVLSDSLLTLKRKYNID